MKNLAPIHSDVIIHLYSSFTKSKKFIELFTGKIQGIIMGPKIVFSEFIKPYAFLMKDLIFVQIARKMNERVKTLLYVHILVKLVRV